MMIISAKDAVVGAQYKSKKGKIIQVLSKNQKGEIQYKCFLCDSSSSIFTGVLKDDYELEEITDDKKIVFTVKTKEEKIEKKVKNFNIRKFVEENFDKSNEWIVQQLEEFQKDGNERAFLASLAVAAKVRGGVSKLAKDTGLNRENLYRSFFKSDPRLSNFVKIINSLGISLKIA